MVVAQWRIDAFFFYWTKCCYVILFCHEFCKWIYSQIRVKAQIFTGHSDAHMLKILFYFKWFLDYNSLKEINLIFLLSISLWNCLLVRIASSFCRVNASLSL